MGYWLMGRDSLCNIYRILWNQLYTAMVSAMINLTESLCLCVLMGLYRAITTNHHAPQGFPVLDLIHVKHDGHPTGRRGAAQPDHPVQVAALVAPEQ